MTKSQENALKNAQNYPSYVKHWMKERDLIIQCMTDYKGDEIHYMLVIGPRGGKQHIQLINGEWKVC